MANHAGAWAPGALVCFGSLDFIITLGGGLERIQAPTRSGGVNTVTNTLQGLRFHRQEQDVPMTPSRCSIDSARLERQLQAVLGPHSTQDDLCCTV